MLKIPENILVPEGVREEEEGKLKCVEGKWEVDDDDDDDVVAVSSPASCQIDLEVPFQIKSMVHKMLHSHS